MKEVPDWQKKRAERQRERVQKRLEVLAKLGLTPKSIVGKERVHVQTADGKDYKVLNITPEGFISYRYMTSIRQIDPLKTEIRTVERSAEDEESRES